MQDMENIEELALVEMNPLDLDIKDGGRVYLHFVFLLDIIGQDVPACLFHLGQPFEEGVSPEDFSGPEAFRFQPPVRPDGVIEQSCQLRIGLDEPAPVGDAVGLIGKTRRETRIELVQRRVFQYLGVYFCYAVDTVAAQNCQMGHMDLPVPENGHVTGLVFVAGEALADLSQPAPVQFLYNEVDPRQQGFEHGDGPAFHRFRQDGVVRIGHGTDGHSIPHPTRGLLRP